MEPLLDFAKLLSPISHQQPAGSDLRCGELLPIYQKTKELRVAARSIERQIGQNTAKSIKPNWTAVYQLSVEILSTQSKDLEVATWLIEALLREAGFLGLADGFKLVLQLCEKFWAVIYPLPDDDGLLSRLSSFIGLNGEDVAGVLITPLALAPLMENAAAEPYTLWHYHQALSLLKITDPEKRAQRIANGGISLEMIENTLRHNSEAFLATQRKAISDCIQQFTALTKFFEEKCGKQAPPSSRILKQLNSCLDCLNCVPSSQTGQGFLATNNIEEIALPPDETQPNTSAREHMLQTLIQAANFFKTTEPHSPLPYILERAVRWAKMPLPKLLQEFVQDENTQKQLAALIGVGFEK